MFRHLGIETVDLANLLLLEEVKHVRQSTRVYAKPASERSSSTIEIVIISWSVSERQGCKGKGDDSQVQSTRSSPNTQYLYCIIVMHTGQWEDVFVLVGAVFLPPSSIL